MAEERGCCVFRLASPFFSAEAVSEGASDNFRRIAFCKTDETTEAASAAFLLLNEPTKPSAYSKEDPHVIEIHQ